MRTIARLFFLLLFLGGVALVALPWLSATVGDREVGIWPVYNNVTGPLRAQAPLTPEDAPVAVMVDMTTVGPASFSDDRVALTITATDADKTVLAETLTFVGAPGRDVNPQTAERIYRARAGVIQTVGAGPYTFNVEPGDSEAVTIKSVALVLRHEGAGNDPRLQPVGFLLMAVGFIGLALSFRRGGNPQNPNSQPPPPRWGRSGAPQA